MKGFLKMETKTYLIKTKFDYSTKELVQVDGNNLTIEFKIMDKYALIEIVGRLKDRTVEEFKHQIICNKNQVIQMLPNVNDQVEKFDQRINENVDRVHFDQVFKNDYQLGLHGQLNEDEYIDPKVIFNTKHLIRDTFKTDVLKELQELIPDVLANREDSQKGTQIDLEDLISEKEGS